MGNRGLHIWCGYLEMAKNRVLTLVEGAPSERCPVGGCCSVLPPGQMAACLRLLIKAFPPSAWRVLFKGRLRVSLYDTVRS